MLETDHGYFERGLDFQRDAAISKEGNGEFRCTNRKTQHFLIKV